MAISSKFAGVLLALTVSAPAFAQDIPVVKALPGLCPSAYAEIETWATIFARNAALAMPTLKTSAPVSCDHPSLQVKGAHAVNAPTLREAKSAALKLCNAGRSADLGPCIIMAYMER